MTSGVKIILLMFGGAFALMALIGIGIFISFRIWGRDKVLEWNQKIEDWLYKAHDDHPGRWVP